MTYGAGPVKTEDNIDPGHILTIIQTDASTATTNTIVVNTFKDATWQTYSNPANATFVVTQGLITLVVNRGGDRNSSVAITNLSATVLTE